MIPTRLCCGQKHFGTVCPDNKVQCCYCFDRVNKDQLVVDPVDGKKWDVCIPCHNMEVEEMRKRGIKDAW